MTQLHISEKMDIYKKKSCASLDFNNTSHINVAHEISTPDNVNGTFLIMSHIKFIKNIQFRKVHENVGLVRLHNKTHSGSVICPQSQCIMVQILMTIM